MNQGDGEWVWVPKGNKVTRKKRRGGWLLHAIVLVLFVALILSVVVLKNTRELNRTLDVIGGREPEPQSEWEKWLDP